MESDLYALAIRFGKRAAKMLLEFANIGPERKITNRLPPLTDADRRIVERFKRHWESDDFKWQGDADGFFWSQHLVREVWKGRKKGMEGFQVELGLGLSEGFDSLAVVRADWNAGSLYLAARNLEDIIWLTLLQNSQRLAICANKDGGCPTPYFVKGKPKQRFCSDVCALPTQREHKRKWWREHGPEWRKKRTRKSRKFKSGKSKTRKRGGKRSGKR